MASFSRNASSSSSSSSKKLDALSAPFNPTTTHHHPHVLLVDDDPSKLHYMATMFTSLGCLVTEAENSTETFHFLVHEMKNKPKLDMICVKYNMSLTSGLHFNGYMTLSIIKSYAPAADIPVVVYCTDPNPDPQQLIELDKCITEGALMVIRKPLRLAEMVDLVKLMKEQ